MKRIFFLIPIFFFLAGCNESEFTEDEDISKYAEEKYFHELKSDEIKFLKCLPQVDATIKVIYTKEARDNAFPATIRFDYINQSYNVYFDKAYKNAPKSQLINDIDLCMKTYIEIKTSKVTWK